MLRAVFIGIPSIAVALFGVALLARGSEPSPPDVADDAVAFDPGLQDQSEHDHGTHDHETHDHEAHDHDGDAADDVPVRSEETPVSGAPQPEGGVPPGERREIVTQSVYPPPDSLTGSVEGMMSAVPIAIVGTFVSAEDCSVCEIPGSPPVDRGEAPPYDPEEDVPSLTVYEFVVDEVMSSSGHEVGAGDTIRIYQPGGLRNDIEYISEGDRLFQVEGRYLLFAQYYETPDWYGVAPFGQFVIQPDGTLEANPVWEGYGAVEPFSGRTLTEAREVIEMAAPRE